MNKLNCRQVQDNFSPYLDNELTPDQVKLFWAHINECPACAVELEEWRRISLAIKEAGSITIAAPAGLRQNIMEALQKEHTRVDETAAPVKKKSGLSRLLATRAKRWAAVAAAASVLTFGSWTAALHMADNSGKQNVADRNQVTEVIHNTPQDDPGNNIPDSNPVINHGQPGGETTVVSDNQSPATGSVGNQEPGNTDTVMQSVTSKNSSTAAPDKPSSWTGTNENTSSNITPGQQLVLFAENMTTSSTSVWMESNAPAEMVKKLESLAKQNEATFNKHTLDTYLGSSYIIKMTVTPKEYDALVTAVKGAGAVTDIKTEKIDLSTQYLKAYARVQELQSELANGAGNAEQIRAQLQDAENLLNRIEAQSKSYTVTVWLQ